MNLPQGLLGSKWIELLGWSLVHSLWQAGLIAAALAVILRLLRSGTPGSRYIAACLAMWLMAILPVATFIRGLALSGSRDLPLAVQFSSGTSVISGGLHQGEPPVNQQSARDQLACPGQTDGGNSGHETWSPQREIPEASVHPTGVSGAGWTKSITGRLVSLSPAAAALWVAGLFLKGAWLLCGGFDVARIRESALPVEETRWRRLDQLRQAMGIRRAVRFLESSHITGPIVVGWLRPAILVPACVLTCLSARELDTLLMHELAHIRRHDYLVNLLQNLVETPLFYHPAVWWVSRRIRIEREYCCDDMVIRGGADSFAYVRALHGLESLLGRQTKFAPAVAGAALLPRIKRIVADHAPASGPQWQTLCAVFVVLAAAAYFAWSFAATKPTTLRRPDESSHAPTAPRSPPNPWRPLYHSSPIVPADSTDTLTMDSAVAKPHDQPEVAIYRRPHSQDLALAEEEPVTLSLPSWGRIAFTSNLDVGQSMKHFLIQPETPGPIAVQVRSIKSIRPFLAVHWPTQKGDHASDTDGGSGRGADCVVFVHDTLPAPDNWVACAVSSQNGTSGKFLVCIWQPRQWPDCDADVAGPESSLLQLDDFGWAQVPSRPNMRPPAIDYAGDVDTFQVWPASKVPLTFTVDGFSGALEPYLRVYDNNGKLVACGPDDTATRLHRITVDGQQAGYFLVVSNRDRHSTGEYSVHVCQSSTDARCSDNKNRRRTNR